MKNNKLLYLFLFLNLFLGFSYLEAEIKPGLLYMNQDFENPVFPPTGWDFTVNAEYDYKWHKTTSCSAYGIGTSSIRAVLIFSATQHSFEFTTNIFSPTSAGDSLKFDHAYTTHISQIDRLVIYTSTNGGAIWDSLFSLNGGIDGPLTTAPSRAYPFVPTSSQWASKKFALPMGINKIKFIVRSCGGNTLYLDNIVIGSAYSVDVGVNSIISPKNAIKPGFVTPKISVKNYGNTTQTFQVNYTISPGNYTSTQTVSNLNEGQMQQITFPDYNFHNNGNYVLKAYTTLENDQNRNNDTMYSSVIITSSPRNMLLEYCTGTWCSWCPCAKEQALALLSQYSNTVVLAYHGDINSNDPFRNFNGYTILGYLSLFAFPNAVIDRTQNIQWSYITAVGDSRNNSNPAAPVNIEIKSKNYNTSTRALTVLLDATSLVTLFGRYRISYVITEDNLIYPQAGGVCTGGENYVHYWVVRNMVNDALGENLNNNNIWNAGQTFSKSFSTIIDSNWIPINCNLQVFAFRDTIPGDISEIQQCIKTPVLSTGINNNKKVLPINCELYQNYPNPFNPKTNIKFAVSKNGNVELKVFDITGKQALAVFNGYMKPGYYNAEIDGTNLSSGVYFYRLRFEDIVYDTKKMILIK